MLLSFLDTTSHQVGPVERQRDFFSSPLKSRSSSFSQSSQSSRGSLSHRKFRHHREPTVLDRPYVIEAMKDALLQSDFELLAKLVREYGLPPSLRSVAWPVLLRTHPYVLEAQNSEETVITKSDTNTEDDRINVKRIRGDIRRMRRYRGSSTSVANEEIIFDTITDFLKVWGSKMPYDIAMVWIADFLIGGDNSQTESGSSGGGSGSSNGSGRSSAGSPREEGSAVLDSSSSTTASSSPDVMGSPLLDGGSQNEQGGFSFAGITAELMPEVFTNVMLVINHTPPEFSQFVSVLRAELPLLCQHFAQEGVLADAIGGDDWLIWWLKWMGIRTFAAPMLARLWDALFAFREEDNVSMMQQHLYTCILIMRENRMRILELDQSECRQYLSHVPASRDTEALIKEARVLAVAAAQKVS